MRTRLSLFTALLLATSCAAAEETPRPMDEMQGDCSNYRWDVSAELALWAMPADEVAAARVRDAAPPVALSKRQSLTLAPSAEVTLPVTPEKNRSSADTFSGLVAVVFAEPGLYRVSADSGVWIDLVQGDAKIASSAFEMQTKCPTVFKVVAYDVPAAGTYLIQLNGAKEASVDIAVTPAP